MWLTLGDYYLIRLSYAVFSLLKKDLECKEKLDKDGLKYIRARTGQLKLSHLLRVALRENVTPEEAAILINQKASECQEMTMGNGDD